MNQFVVAMAKLAGIRNAVSAALNEKGPRDRLRIEFDPTDVDHYFKQSNEMLKILRSLASELFNDFQEIEAKPNLELGSPSAMYYSKYQLERLVRDIDQIFELRANSELMPVQYNINEPKKRVFLTHGRSLDWYQVQSHIEKDVKISTLELAQETNQGKTIIEKLSDNSDLCDSAVIVMTGDDIGPDGSARSRENVMHEIGYFQGKFGRSKVILLHEEGVSIPTNLAGLVYIPFPKGMVSAGFHVLSRELSAIYSQ